MLRRLYGNAIQDRLVMLRVRLELTPVEAAMWAYDSLAPEIPAPPPPLLTVQPVALCAIENGFFSAGAANATLVELPAAGLLATPQTQVWFLLAGGDVVERGCRARRREERDASVRRGHML